MNNYICPACNIEYDYIDSLPKDSYYAHDHSTKECKVSLIIVKNINFSIYLNDLSNLRIGFILNMQGFEIRNNINRIYFDYKIDNYIEAYKTLIKFKENILFL
jgi:hypothetical protein